MTMPASGARRRLCVIYNPTAGWRRRGRLDRVLKLLRDYGCAVTLLETRSRGDAERYARTLDAAAFDAVVAAGGDGTINEVINGLAGRGLPLGLVPLGTANVLAAEIGIATAPRAIAESIAWGRPFEIFLGTANNRYFAMMVGAGFDARVVEGVDLRLKRAIGKGAYGASTLAALWRLRPAGYEVELDSERLSAAAVIIAKGHYYGGRFVVAADADLAQPQLHVALFGGARRIDILRYGAALFAGRIDALADVRIRQARTVRVTGPVGERVQVDGDTDGVLPLEVALAERRFALLR